MKNPYLPIPTVGKKTYVETTDRMLRTVELGFLNEADEKAFHFTPGQFCELSLLGKGATPTAPHSIRQPIPKPTSRHSVQQNPAG